MFGRCWSCGASEPIPFYELTGIPISSCILLGSAAEARGFPKGDLTLCHCTRCGFIQNARFDAKALDYSEDFEESQAFSPTFAAFAQELVDGLIERHGLRGKEVFEIGCGKGDFLSMICTSGGNRGLGIDPGYREGRIAPEADVTVIRDFFVEPKPELTGDLVCCRHTLEHIQEVAEFVTLVRRSAAQRPGSVVFFEVPDVMRILEEGAFWDVYYEHCSYFTLGSLGRLFRATGFEIISLRTAYDDQYLHLEARVGDRGPSSAASNEDDFTRVEAGVRSFAHSATGAIASWDRRLAEAASAGRRVVIWGASSKGIAFLTSLEHGGTVEYAVDVNPHKQGRFLAGSGQEVVGPDFLVDYEPDLVIVMNPIYVEEIRADLAVRGLEPALMAV